MFNRVLGFFFRSSRIEFDDDWEEKSELAANGLALLRCSLCHELCHRGFVVHIDCTVA